jgi:hypothetical protein
MAELRNLMELDTVKAAGIPAPSSIQVPAGGRPLPPVPAYRPARRTVQARET